MGKRGNRIKVAMRQIDEYFSGERKNPRICLTESEAEEIMREKGVYIRKGNIANEEHKPILYMYKIVAR